jgi:hypothetical protein
MPSWIAMPCNERTELALDALAGPLEAFRSAVTVTAQQLRARVARSRSGGEEEWQRVRAQLGPFASDKIDSQRFSKLLEVAAPLDPGSVEVVEGALDTLIGLVSRRELFAVEVETGGSLRDAVAGALASLGRAFGAARVAELSRTGAYRASEHAEWLQGFATPRWSRAERAMAPPLVVELDGSDLRAAVLSEFLEGSQKIVLLVRGEAPPAALVRLVTPHTFVLQTSDAAELGRVAGFAGPGVAALVPESAARFVHDPAGGAHLHQRITVVGLPKNKSCDRLGDLSGFQQTEELGQLEALVQDKLRAEYEEKLAEVKASYPQVVARRLPGGWLRAAGAGGDLTEMPAEVDVGAVPAATPDVSQAPTEVVGEEAVEEREDGGLAKEPYIETPRCTTCDECTRLNKEMFAYDGNKQAYIKDPKAGTFKQLVIAAERCTAEIIHPGTPLNPDEKGLAKWLKRAKRFK